MIVPRKKYLLILLTVATVSVASVCCKKKKTTEPATEPIETFDKQALLVNLADNLILPAYRDLNMALDSVALCFNTFKNTGSVADFQNLKITFHSAYLKYQYVSLFGFGPGEDAGVRINFNVFPCDTVKISANISLGAYNLASASNVATKGFPALDFLLFGYRQNEPARMNALKSEINSTKYFNDVLTDMRSKAGALVLDWNNTYRTIFINSLGTDVGSSLGFVINQLNFELDYLKNSKIATPLGLKSDGNPKPDNCEAYYSGYSVEFAIATLKSIENVYLGRSLAGNNGKGFDDYLDHLGAKHLDEGLNDAIKTQFASAYSKLKAVADPLSTQVLSNKGSVESAYKELVKLLVLLKTDMPSSLGVVITYQDGDGD